MGGESQQRFCTTTAPKQGCRVSKLHTYTYTYTHSLRGAHCLAPGKYSLKRNVPFPSWGALETGCKEVDIFRCLLTVRVQASHVHQLALLGFMLVPPACHNTSAQAKQLKDTKLIKTTTACILACNIHPRGHVVSNLCSGTKKQPVSKHVGFFA